MYNKCFPTILFKQREKICLPGAGTEVPKYFNAQVRHMSAGADSAAYGFVDGQVEVTSAAYAMNFPIVSKTSATPTWPVAGSPDPSTDGSFIPDPLTSGC